MESVYLALTAMIWRSCGRECIWVGLGLDSCSNLILRFGDDTQALKYLCWEEADV